MTHCPCCGEPLRDLGLRWSLPTRTVIHGTVAVQFGPLQARLFDILFRTYPERLSRFAITERLYADDADGGPDSTNIVSVQILHINKKLKPTGVRVGRALGVREGIALEMVQ